MSIYRKFVILYEYTEKREGEGVREYTPYEINMLNAVKLLIGSCPKNLNIKEITSSYWEIKFFSALTRREVFARISMTDEILGEQQKPAAGRKLRAPTFK